MPASKKPKFTRRQVREILDAYAAVKRVKDDIETESQAKQEVKKHDDADRA